MSTGLVFALSILALYIALHAADGDFSGSYDADRGSVIWFHQKFPLRIDADSRAGIGSARVKDVDRSAQIDKPLLVGGAQPGKILCLCKEDVILFKMESPTGRKVESL